MKNGTVIEPHAWPRKSSHPRMRTLASNPVFNTDLRVAARPSAG